MKARFIYTIALAIAALDQLSKSAVASRLPYGASVPLFGPADITLVRNSGGAFGLFQSSTVPLTVISLVVVIGIVILSRNGRRLAPLVGWALALQLGGAIGNLADRIRLGYVVDFIDLRVWPVFNVADIAITGGILLLAAHIIFCDRAARTARESAPAESEPAKR